MDFIRNQTGRCCYKDRSTTAVGRPSSVQSFQAAKKKTLGQASARRNTIGPLVHKGSLGFAVLSNQLEPVQGDDFSDDGLSSFNIIFIFTFLLPCLQRRCFWLGSAYTE